MAKTLSGDDFGESRDLCSAVSSVCLAGASRGEGRVRRQQAEKGVYQHSLVSCSSLALQELIFSGALYLTLAPLPESQS